MSFLINFMKIIGSCDHCFDVIIFLPKGEMSFVYDL